MRLVRYETRRRRIVRAQEEALETMRRLGTTLDTMGQKDQRAAIEAIAIAARILVRAERT